MTYFKKSLILVSTIRTNLIIYKKIYFLNSYDCSLDPQDFSAISHSFTKHKLSSVYEGLNRIFSVHKKFEI